MLLLRTTQCSSHSTLTLSVFSFRILYHRTFSLTLKITKLSSESQIHPTQRSIDFDPLRTHASFRPPSLRTGPHYSRDSNSREEDKIVLYSQRGPHPIPPQKWASSNFGDVSLKTVVYTLTKLNTLWKRECCVKKTLEIAHALCSKERKSPRKH